MSEKAGICFGKIYISAMLKQFKQLDHGAMPRKPVLGHVDPDNLNKYEKQAEL